MPCTVNQCGVVGRGCLANAYRPSNDYFCDIPPIRNSLKKVECSNFMEHFQSPFEMKKFYQPKWVTYAGMNLTFYGYWQEPIPESPIETYRVHQCVIHYFLVDDTIEVNEPYTPDPGYVQGRIIKRQKIPLPGGGPCGATAEEEFFTSDHFRVGAEVVLYGKTFKITGCSESTRRFLNRTGVPLLPNMEMPSDQGNEKRIDDIKYSHFAKKGYPNTEGIKMQKYYQNTGKILKFGAYWDDRCSFKGRLRKFFINYHLEDDTIDIFEVFGACSIEPRNADDMCCFLKRVQVPKNPEGFVGKLGNGIREDAIVVLSVIAKTRDESSFSHKAGVHYDSLCPGVENQKDFYKDADLAIGATLNVFGRAFIITHMRDEHTKFHYCDKFGIEDFTPLMLDEPKERLPVMEMPPHNGFGSEDDTALNWDNYKAAKECKVCKYDPCLFNYTDFLSFRAKLCNTMRKVNSERRFEVRYYVHDETIEIYELPHPNSGFKRGLFLRKSKAKKCPHPGYVGEIAECYGPRDFYVGNTLHLNSFEFMLLRANEITHSIMERYPDIFPQSSVCAILDKIREATGPEQTCSIGGSFGGGGVMDACMFEQNIKNVTRGGLSEHEIVTLKRYYQGDKCEGAPDFCTLQSVVQTELRKNQFDRSLLERIEFTLRHYDPCRCGMVDRETLKSSLKGAKLPLDKAIINFLVERYPSGDDCCRVNYCDFMKFMDWECNPVMMANPSSVSSILSWLEPDKCKMPVTIDTVKADMFMQDICPNYCCQQVSCPPPVFCCQTCNCDPCHCQDEPCPPPPCRDPCDPCFIPPTEFPVLHENYLKYHKDCHNGIRLS